MDLEKYLQEGFLKVSVKPNSSSTEITGFDEARGELKVNVSAPADKNKANIEIIKFFSKLTGREVKIKSGLSSRRKTLKLS